MKSVLTLAVLLFCLQLSAQEKWSPLMAKDTTAQNQWVDSLYTAMSLDEKIGQLFMVDVFSKAPRADIEKLIEEYHIGGIIFSKGGPQRQAKLTNTYQSKSKYPLMIAMDAEWGLAMRLDSTYAFPWNMTLGAIKNKETVNDVALQIAKHCKALGVHINFAPVADVNNNPKNPIIGNRSFGEDKYNVTEKAKIFVEAFDEVGILSSAKHFPGHGDTDVDSHKSLPTLQFTVQRLDSIEIYPFKELVDTKLSSVMVAHLNVPSLESENGLPTSLSKRVVNDLLIKKLGFKGLIFTDALNMKGVSNFDEPGEIDLQAFLAGNDILLISENVPKAVAKLRKAYKKKEITEERLSHSVKKILMAKYKAGLYDYKPIDTEKLSEKLTKSKNDAVYMNAISEAVSVIKNNEGILPFNNLDEEHIAYLKLGKDNNSVFFEVLNRYTKVDSVSSTLKLNEKIDVLKAYDAVIIGHHTSDADPWKSFQISDKELVALHEISLTIPTILVNFASPYALNSIRSFTNLSGVVQAFQNSEIAQSATAQILFGARPALGKLPVGINDKFPVGTGFSYDSNGRLGYGFADNQGIDPIFERKIDSIVNYALSQKMTPGAQVLIAKNGKTIYNKNFGYHTYENKQRVSSNDVYDLASLTKILVSLPLFMEMEEHGNLNLNDSLSQHLPELLHTNKSNISFIKMLSHYAKLQPWIPFYLGTIEQPEEYFSDKPDFKHTTKVAKNMYVRNDFTDSIYLKIIESELRSKDEYKYSDLPYYFLKRIIERHYNAGLSYLIEDRFYNKMGIRHLKYQPLNYFYQHQIVPTENDVVFRYQLLRGYVHDQGAALQGGVGGHAGLFGNAQDVAKFMQMYLNNGRYGDFQLLNKRTIEKFNNCYFCQEDVRRGVGFDKPQLEDEGPTCGCLSMDSFGHSGFTGTYTWADPEYNIVYVFLSNRIHPSADNRGLIEESIRTEIQRVIYEYVEN